MTKCANGSKRRAITGHACHQFATRGSRRDPRVRVSMLVRRRGHRVPSYVDGVSVRVCADFCQ